MSGKEYKELRIALGYSQTGLAERLGVSRPTIVRRESAEEVGEEAKLAILSLKRKR